MSGRQLPYTNIDMSEPEIVLMRTAWQVLHRRLHEMQDVVVAAVDAADGVDQLLAKGGDECATAVSHASEMEMIAVLSNLLAEYIVICDPEHKKALVREHQSYFEVAMKFGMN